MYLVEKWTCPSLWKTFLISCSFMKHYYNSLYDNICEGYWIFFSSLIWQMIPQNCKAHERRNQSSFLANYPSPPALECPQRHFFISISNYILSLFFPLTNSNWNGLQGILAYSPFVHRNLLLRNLRRDLGKIILQDPCNSSADSLKKFVRHSVVELLEIRAKPKFESKMW